MQGASQQRRRIKAGFGGAGLQGILAELFQVAGQLALSLQQQGLWVCGQFAGSQQLVVAEVAQLFKAGAPGLGQSRGQ